MVILDCEGTLELVVVTVMANGLELMEWSGVYLSAWDFRLLVSNRQGC